MKPIRKIIDIANAISEYTGRAIAWLTTLLVIVVCYDVFTRYCLGRFGNYLRVMAEEGGPALAGSLGGALLWLKAHAGHSVGIQELEWHLFGLIFMLGAAYTLRHDKHVRVDILYTRLPKRRKAWINAIGTLIFLIPFCLLIIWTSQNYVLAAWRIKEGSPNPGGLPAWYLLKTAIPLGGLLLLIQGIALLLESLLTALGKDQETDAGEEAPAEDMPLAEAEGAADV